MDQLKNYYKEMGVEEKVFDYAQEVEKGLKDRFEKLDAIAQLNQIKVLNAMQKHQIAEMHLGGTCYVPCLIYYFFYCRFLWHNDFMMACDMYFRWGHFNK